MANSVYNMLPVDNPLVDHAALLFPEVRASIAALRTVGELRRPNGVRWTHDMDLLDWLGAWFGFQEGNVKNQREHLVLLLANAQMRLQPQATNRLDAKVLKKIRKKVTTNYVSWCNFIRQRSNLE